MAIDRDIHDLLYDHDCVIVPGFGGLLTHRRGARLDTGRHLVHPPSKDLSFNRKLTRSDGLLADRVARRLGVPHDQALDLIEAAVAQWERHMERSGRVELPEIGTFFHDRERNLQFEPDRRVNYLKDAFGLRAVTAVPLLRPKPATVPVVRELTPPVPSSPARTSAAAFWAAAAITGALFALGAYWATRPGAMNGVQLGSFDPFAPEETARYQVRDRLPAVLETEDTASWGPAEGAQGVQAAAIAGAQGPMVNVDFGGPEASANTPETAAADKTRVATGTERAFRYHVIGGCFSLKENAERFLEQLRATGFDAVLVDEHHGLYRVAFGSYPERSMALEALAAVRREQGTDAWLLVK